MSLGRKTISAALAALLMLGTLYASALASEEPASDGQPAEAVPVEADAVSETEGGVCGVNTAWTLTEDGLLTIYGDGTVTEHPWDVLSSSIRRVTVQEGVTALCGYAFYRCPALEQASLPEGLAEISEFAFHECLSLREVTIPTSVRVIGEQAFYGCGKLETVRYAGTEAQWRAMDIGWLNGPLWGASGYSPAAQGTDGDMRWALESGVLSITGTGAMDAYDRGAPWYEFAETVRCVEIGEGVTSVGAYAFQNCRNLMEVSLPDSVTAIGDFAFLNCEKLERAVLPPGLQTLGSGVFSGCERLEREDLPSGLVSISPFLFQDCAALRAVTIPAGVTVIGEGAFRNCAGLAEASIPVSAARIGDTAFAGCAALCTVRYDGTEEQWSRIEIGYGNEALLSARGGALSVFSDMDGLAALLAAGSERAEYVGEATFRIDRDLVIPATATVVFHAPTVVAEGVTVENYGTVAFDAVTVRGAFRNYGSAGANDVTGAENISSFGDNYFVKTVNAASEAELRAALSTDDGLRPCVRLTGDAVLSEDLAVARGAAIELAGNVRLTVRSGAVLVVEGSVRVGSGILSVEGTLRNDAYWDGVLEGGSQGGVTIGKDGWLEVTGGRLEGGGVVRLVGASPEEALRGTIGPEHFGILYQTEDLCLLSYSGGEAPLVWGDADGDGTADLYDAAAILRHAVGRRPPDSVDPEAGDVNGDGRIDAADAALLLSFVNGTGGGGT